MKKEFLSIAALLLGLLAYSQEADNLGNHAEVTIIPRLDITPTYNADDSEFGFNHGNSSIYTLFEGSASEHFSWTVANHWISTGGDYGWPYDNLGCSNSTNWLDLCLANLTFDNWTFSVGKDLISTGGFEFEDWDWDVYTDFASPLWNGLSCYQWGGKVAYTTNSGLSTFSLQMVSSPYGEHPFSSGLWAYSGQWRGEYGWFSNIWSVSALQHADGFDYLISLGQSASFDEWAVTFNANNNCGFEDADGSFNKGLSVQGTLNFAPSERFNVSLKGSYVAPSNDALVEFFNVGTIAEFYPISDSDDLRLHAYVNYNSALNKVALCVGARYNLRIKVW